MDTNHSTDEKNPSDNLSTPSTTEQQTTNLPTYQPPAPSGGGSVSGKPRFLKVGAALFAILIGVVGAYVLLSSRAAEPTFETEKTANYQLLSDKLKADARAYQSDLPAAQKPEVSEMKKIAQQRKRELLLLAKTDPDAFLANTLSKEEKAKLPKEVSELVEESIEAEGLFTGDTVVVNGRTYTLNYNKSVPLFVDPNTTTNFKGYVLDDQFVIPATPDGYKENTRSTSNEKPFANVKNDTIESAAGGIVTLSTAFNGTGTVIPGVPGYIWRDGCGPTAVGMILGYWDGHGYGNLVSGDATTQTGAVQQMMASHSVSGERRHYEDYSLPKETGSTVLADRSALPTGDEHVADSVADYMQTSWSADGMQYGWSYSSRIASAFTTYFTKKYPTTTVQSATHTYSSGAMTFELLKQEVAAKRPFVLLVDTTGDGRTDHFVTAVGYRTSNGYNEYGVWDTWSTSGLRWERFRAMSTSYTWGVWGGVTFRPAAATTAPVISSFTANPISITAGQSATLNWVVNGTNTVSINQNIGAVAPTGSKVVAPTATTTYTLTAANSGGTVTKTVTVTVSPAPTPTPTPTPTPAPTTDTTPPAVSISGLSNGATYNNGNYTVTGNATDASGIGKIEIYLGNTLVATCTNTTQCSHSFNMKKLASGAYTVKVVAYDRANPANSAFNTVTFTKR